MGAPHCLRHSPLPVIPAQAGITCDLRRAANAPDVRRPRRRRPDGAIGRFGRAARGRWNATASSRAVAWIPAYAGMTQWANGNDAHVSPDANGPLRACRVHRHARGLAPASPLVAYLAKVFNTEYPSFLRRQESMRSEARRERWPDVHERRVLSVATARSGGSEAGGAVECNRAAGRWHGFLPAQAMTEECARACPWLEQGNDVDVRAS